VIDGAVNMLSRYLGLKSAHKVAGQYHLDAEYFARIETINFALQHDDGQQTDELREADVVLVGVSRTSKTPTCVYLGNRGVKAANVPLVPGVEVPEILTGPDAPLVVGLKISPDRLVQIRRHRLLSLNETPDTSYADEETVRQEVTEANRLYMRMKWPTIDVSRRSVEETAAAILNIIQEHERQHASQECIQQSQHRLILASKSSPRASVMRSAGLVHTDNGWRDEDAITAMCDDGASCAEQADRLAETKAMKVFVSNLGVVLG
jgi:hypothetical protein